MGEIRKLDCRACGKKHERRIPDDILKMNKNNLWLEEADDGPNSSITDCGARVRIGGN